MQVTTLAQVCRSREVSHYGEPVPGDCDKPQQGWFPYICTVILLKCIITVIISGAATASIRNSEEYVHSPIDLNVPLVSAMVQRTLEGSGV